MRSPHHPPVPGCGCRICLSLSRCLSGRAHAAHHTSSRSCSCSAPLHRPATRRQTARTIGIRHSVGDANLVSSFPCSIRQLRSIVTVLLHLPSSNPPDPPELPPRYLPTLRRRRDQGNATFSLRTHNTSTPDDCEPLSLPRPVSNSTHTHTHTLGHQNDTHGSRDRTKQSPSRPSTQTA